MNPYQSSQAPEGLNMDSQGWVFFVKASFAISLTFLLAGIVVMPLDLIMRGYLVMGTFFVVGSSISLSKTMRDRFEAQRMIHRLAQARAEKMLRTLEDGEEQ